MNEYEIGGYVIMLGEYQYTATKDGEVVACAVSEEELLEQLEL